MARTDDDTWDLASSVGATATMVAAARAMATKDPRRLIDDPFADPLVRAVGMPFFVDLLDGRIDVTALGDDGAQRAASMVAGMAMRTKFFDEYFLQATAGGIRQVVILASGLDSRAYRLAWPSGTVVYEIDQPEVIGFKTATLADLGAQPTAERRPVALDLREDWPAALRTAGFDPSAPTAWLAEGLLVYLPSDAQDRLLDTITGLSAAGSALGTEYVPGIVDFDADRSREMTAGLRERGLDLDMSSLVYAGPRSNVIDHLDALGWTVRSASGDELLRQHDLEPPVRDERDPFGEVVYLSATLA